MIKQNFIDKDLNGQEIQQRAKDSKSVEIDGNSRFTGHRFLLKTKLYGDKRCVYCGKWFHWKDTDSLTWLRMGNINTGNMDNVLEPLHCGSLHCQEFHHLWIKEIERRRQLAMENQGWRLFRDLLHKRVVK